MIAGLSFPLEYAEECFHLFNPIHTSWVKKGSVGFWNAIIKRKTGKLGIIWPISHNILYNM
jgi:hypothetical protein